MKKTYDVCIIGSGITGTLAAEHFVRQGLDVLMVERGKEFYLPDKPEEYWHEEWKFTSDAPLISRNTWNGAEKHFDDLVEIENTRKEFAFHYNMKYGIGGSGAVWSGASWRLTPEDFKTRTLFGYGSDWPFSYEELSPFYDRVEEIFFTSGPKSIPDWPWRNNYKYPAFKQSYLDKVVGDHLAPEFILTPSPFSVRNEPPLEGGCVGAKTCVTKCPANARFRPDLHILQKIINKQNLKILPGTPCLSINPDKKGTIASITVWNNGKPETIKSKYFFLAANTIENLRILLNSDLSPSMTSQLGLGFASHGTMVLSITMEERLYVGRGRPTTSSAINTLNHPARKSLNSFMLEIWNLDFTIGSAPHAALINLRKKERHWGRTLLQKTREADSRFAAVFIFEMEMRRQNRITLSHVKDQFGLPLAKVDFSPGERDRLTFRHLQRTAENLGKKSGIKDVRISGYGLNGNHPLGGYRAGSNPDASVVDPWMRSHHYRNLYILGGGAFSSTGALNPTHTIAALTLKALSDKRISF